MVVELLLFKIAISSGMNFEARHWRLVSVCELRMFFNNALDVLRVKVLDKIV